MSDVRIHLPGRISAAALDLNTVRELGEELSQSRDWRVRHFVASSITASARVIARLVDDPVPLVAEAARSNLKAPMHRYHPETLDPFGVTVRELRQEYLRLTERREMFPEQHDESLLHQFWRRRGHLMTVRLWFASDPGTDSRILRELSRSNRPERTAVAANPATPPAVLRKLAADSVPSVRVNVAMNVSTPRRTLSLLARDPDVTVRRALEGRATGSALILNWRSDAAASVHVQDDADLAAVVSAAPSSRATIRGFDVAALPTILRHIADARGRTEALAVHAVLELERIAGHRAQEQVRNNRGFDIESQRHGTMHLIEVKGLGPEASTVHVSRAQIEFSRTHASTFELAVVTIASDLATSVIRVSNPYPAAIPDSLVSVELDVGMLARIGTITFLDYDGKLLVGRPGHLFGGNP